MNAIVKTGSPLHKALVRDLSERIPSAGSLLVARDRAIRQRLFREAERTLDAAAAALHAASANELGFADVFVPLRLHHLVANTLEASGYQVEEQSLVSEGVVLRITFAPEEQLDTADLSTDDTQLAD